MVDLSPVLVAADQDRRQGLVKLLQSRNVPARVAEYQPFDLMWTVGGKPVTGDLKTVADFIKSYQDGRFHDQITAMRKLNPFFYFIFLSGPRTEDNGATCGRYPHSWGWSEFEDARLDLQVYGGVKIIESHTYDQIPDVLAAVWRWTGKERVSAWQAPVPQEATNDFTIDPQTGQPKRIFYDETFRSQVGVLMHLPGCGVVLAKELRDRFPFVDILGITEEGLEKAAIRWASIKGVGAKRVQQWKEFITF